MMDATLCLHCGQPTGGLDDQPFCCLGCQAVYRILKSGPFSEYYEIREKGVCFSAPSPVKIKDRDYAFWNQNADSEIQIYIEGIHCTACVWLLERLSIAIPKDVRSSSLNLGQNLLRVELKPGADRARIASTIESFGYRPLLIENEAEGASLLERENRKRLIDIGVAGALSGNVMLMSIPLYSGVEGGYRTLFEWLSFLLAIPSVFYCGRSFFNNVQAGYRNRVFPIDGPILLAILVAFFYSGWSTLISTHDLYFDSLTALVFLLLSSRYYLSRIRQSTGLKPGLMGLFHPPFDGSPGDQVSLQAGSTLNFDGKILHGIAWIDQSHFTGESSPARVGPGDAVFAGCRVVDAEPQVRVLVEKCGASTRLQKMILNLDEARNRRTSFEQSIERWARTLLMVVLGVAFVFGVNFWIMGLGADGMKRILALLIVTCPCALAFATPLVYSLAARVLMEKGMLLKNPESLDRALNVKTIYFDKTGTLTFGSLRVDSRPLAGLSPEERVVLGSLTLQTHHPVSSAVYREICEFIPEFIPKNIESFREIPGTGVEGTIEGVRYGIRKNPEPNRYGVQFLKFLDGGQEKEILTLCFEDELRPDTQKVLETLKNLGFNLELLSGDHENNARRILKGVPIHIRAGLSPEQKAEFAQSGMMVGDGVNDALALIRSKIGFSVQGGIEAAIDSSDIYSITPGVSGVIGFFQVAKTVRKVLIFNFGISTAYNFFGGFLALTGHMSPLLAAVLMPLSATSVFLNSSAMMKRGGK